MNRFEPGEVAVLLNDLGGRLFVVHSIDDKGRVVEKSRIESQQKYAYGINPGALVKVPSIEAADMLVATLARIHSDFEQRAWKLNAERSREMAMAIKPYIDITPPATPILCGGCMKPISFDLVLGTRCECATKVQP